MAGLSYIGGVTTIALDRAKCTGCWICMKVCPHPVFARVGDAVAIVAPDACMECGACVLNCADDALSVNPGVGCAAAILRGWITRSQPRCA